MNKQKVANSICATAKRTLLTRYRLYVIWYRLCSFTRTRRITQVYNTSIFQLRKCVLERKQHASLKLPWKYICCASQTAWKQNARHFSFFLRKSFIGSINPIIRFLATIVRLYMLENKYRSINGLAKNTLGRGKRSIFLYLTFKYSFEESEDAWAIVYIYIYIYSIWRRYWKKDFLIFLKTVFSPIPHILTSRFGRNVPSKIILFKSLIKLSYW